MAGSPITPESTVSEVLERWPQTIPVFIRYKAYCLGCCMITFDPAQPAQAVLAASQPAGGPGEIPAAGGAARDPEW
jgi:hypothetical protein